MKSSLKPTSEDIDRGLVEVAAFVFAQHGFAQGPVQAIADAAGYSKAAVLKRFGSKERIQDAVIERTEQHAARIAAAADGLPVGPERDAALLHALVDLIAEWPGTGALIVGAFWLTREPVILQRLSRAQHTLMEAFDPDIWTFEERHIRVVAAIGAVTVTMMANRDVQWTHRKDLMVVAALGALGHIPAGG